MNEIEKKQIIEIINTEIDRLEDKIEGLKEYTAPIAPDDCYREGIPHGCH